jgi:hypothetical protein
MPNPLEQLAGTGLVSDAVAILNANGQARHQLGLTELTDADDGYELLDDDELIVCTLGADMGITLPDPATVTPRSLYVALGDGGGFTLTLTPASGNINGAGTLDLTTNYSGVRLVARASEWLAI